MTTTKTQIQNDSLPQPTALQPTPEPIAQPQQASAEIEAGLRFVHQMEVQGRSEQTQLAIETSALVDLLIAKGVVSAREFDERKQSAAREQEKRDANKSFPILSGDLDKYKVKTPDIPCSTLLPVCRAACCNLSFSLSLQDLDEGVIRWNYGVPYQNRQNPKTCKCSHFDNSNGCTAYSYRPAVCRSYDCREDKRIWKDYNKRIPSDDLTKLAPVAVVATQPE